MKAIVEYTAQEYNEMKDKQHELFEKIKGYTYGELIAFVKTYGYAHYGFSGVYTESLVEALGREPTPDEIIILVDGGFSHFGATCNINGRHFRGRVNTD